jgi:hypothetical protein
VEGGLYNEGCACRSCVRSDCVTMGCVKRADQSQQAHWPRTVAAAETMRGDVMQSHLPHDRRCDQASESPPWGA